MKFLSWKRWHSQGIETSEKGLLIKPEDPFCLTMRALALFDLGRIQEATVAFENLLGKNPCNKSIRRMLMLSYIMTFQRSQSHDFVQRSGNERGSGATPRQT